MQKPLAWLPAVLSLPEKSPPSPDRRAKFYLLPKVVSREGRQQRQTRVGSPKKVEKVPYVSTGLTRFTRWEKGRNSLLSFFLNLVNLVKDFHRHLHNNQKMRGADFENNRHADEAFRYRPSRFLSFGPR